MVSRICIPNFIHIDGYLPKVVPLHSVLPAVVRAVSEAKRGSVNLGLEGTLKLLKSRKYMSLDIVNGQMRFALDRSL